VSEVVDRLKEFVTYVGKLDGDEKGEAQVFCDRLFKAFGHAGYKEAGATLEQRIKKKSTKGTSFADLVWKPRVLIEMKKRGEKLHLHYSQAFDYWLNAVPNRPRYVVLCNFDEFWIYDFDTQLTEPVDRLEIGDLPARYTALNFLFDENKDPQFKNNIEEVSRTAASQTAELFRDLVSWPGKGVPREQAQRFVLQLVVAMFAEDIDLLPSGTIVSIVKDCLERKQSPYDLFGGLFKQMNNPKSATAGRYAGVPYFNGGLFAKVASIDLPKYDLELIGGEKGAAQQDWTKVNPAIFGTLFQQSMDQKVQHQHGRHFTSEADIQRIVIPTMIRPWRGRIDGAKTMKELLALRSELAKFRVLDPACGSGNFLYVAFRELARLDIRIMSRLSQLVSAKEFQKQAKVLSAVSPKQFYGLDNDPFGVELAKVTLMIAKKLAHDEAVAALIGEGEAEYGKGNIELDLVDDSLPLDNLDDNIKVADALFTDWPEVDCIVGNPPYQSKNKIKGELDPAYVNKLRQTYPAVDGRADYCVYWFRIAHDHLKLGQRAGLVGTNTIRQNYSREGGLDYIVDNGGTITEAVSSMIWPGEAVVHVSIVNWVRGEESGSKRLYLQEGNDVSAGWQHADLDRIGPSLSFHLDVTKAKKIKVNAEDGGCYQGQTHGHKAFLLKPNTAKLLDKRYRSVVRPFMTSDDLVGELDSRPTRYVIDFRNLTLLEAKTFPKVFDKVQTDVLPSRKKAAAAEEERNKALLGVDSEAHVNHHHANFLKKWWIMSYPREDMMKEISKLSRYIACGRVTKRPIFDFVSPEINPNDALTVFAHEDDYSFGILQSGIHWRWFVERCSTIKSDPRYTSNTVFDSFPWPQAPALSDIRAVAKAAVAFRATRQRLRSKHKLSLRDLYRMLELPGDNELKEAQEELDNATRAAYGVKKGADALVFLLALNAEVVALEVKGKKVQGPGLPDIINDPSAFISTDCIKP
jgi:hypothetical protein